MGNKGLILLVLGAGFYSVLLGFIYQKYWPGNVAGTTSVIRATVALSYCGNGIVEDGEQCEAVTYNQQSCQEFGYQTEGVVECDRSCDFDLRNCFKLLADGPTIAPIIAISETPVKTMTIQKTEIQQPTKEGLTLFKIIASIAATIFMVITGLIRFVFIRR